MVVAGIGVVAAEMEKGGQAWVVKWHGGSREGGFENDPQVSALCGGWRGTQLTETRSTRVGCVWKQEDTPSGLCRDPAEES